MWFDKSSFFDFVFVTIVFCLFCLYFQDYERSLRQLSLDDIERLAGRLLHPDGEGMDTSYMDWRCFAASPLLWLCVERDVLRVWHFHLTVCVVLLRSSQLISGWLKADRTDCCLLQPWGFPVHNWENKWEHLTFFYYWYYYCCCYYFWNWQRNQFVLFVSQDLWLLKLLRQTEFCSRVFVRNICVQ